RRVVGAVGGADAGRRPAHRRAVPLHRAAGALLMPGSRNAWLAHAVLIFGVVIFAFPIYLAVIGSTHDASTIARGQMPLTPGDQALETYSQALRSGEG